MSLTPAKTAIRRIVDVGLLQFCASRMAQRFRPLLEDERMMCRFWTGGPAAYEKGLLEQWNQVKAGLKAKLAKCEEAERKTLESEAAELEREIKSKLDGIDDCIF